MKIINRFSIAAVTTFATFTLTAGHAWQARAAATTVASTIPHLTTYAVDESRKRSQVNNKQFVEAKKELPKEINRLPTEREQAFAELQIAQKKLDQFIKYELGWGNLDFGKVAIAHMRMFPTSFELSTIFNLQGRRVIDKRREYKKFLRAVTEAEERYIRVQTSQYKAKQELNNIVSNKYRTQEKSPKA